MAVVTSLHECRGINNRLLLAMSPATLDRILRISEPVSLVRGQQIVTAGQPIKFIHFINRGLVCATKTMEDGRMVEIAAIGGWFALAWLSPMKGFHCVVSARPANCVLFGFKQSHAKAR